VLKIDDLMDTQNSKKTLPAQTMRVKLFVFGVKNAELRPFGGLKTGLTN
jgi:hypothetical protein